MRNKRTYSQKKKKNRFGQCKSLIDHFFGSKIQKTKQEQQIVETMWITTEL